MGVDHCCFDVAVAPQFLHRADVVAGGQQVRGEGMTKRMAGDRLRQTGLVSGLRDGLLDERFVDVVPSLLASPGIPPAMLLWRHELPVPLATRIRLWNA